jgi:parallel beta-helix repeat protein
MTFATATLVFDVRTTGSDNNGGGFDSGVASPGTDYSQQDSAQIAYTDLVIGTTGNENQLTSAAHPFDSTSPGNCINITGGTGFLARLYRIVSVSGNTATMDRVVGTANATGGTGNLGGAFATINNAIGNMGVGGQITYIKAGTYQTIGLAAPYVTTGTALSRIVGYSSTRGDSGQATIQVNAANVILASWNSGTSTSGVSLENIIFDGNNQTTSNGFTFQGLNFLTVSFINCTFKRFTDQYCLRVAGSINIHACDFAINAFTNTSYVSGCILGEYGSGAGAAGGGTFVNVSDCYFTGNTISSLNFTAAAIYGKNIALSVNNSIFYNNSSSNMDGIYLQNAMAVNISNNAIHSNGRHGINIVSDSTNSAACTIPNIRNNIITSNGGYGIKASYDYSTTLPMVNHNAYYNNTSGAKTGFTAGAGEVTLTGLPYVNAPTDFALNSTAGQGASCRAAAIPGTLGVSSVVGTGYLDIGPLQHSGGVSSAYTFVA